MPRLDFLLGLQADGIEPPALVNRPKLTWRQSWLMEIFEDLSSSRSFSMSGPMPVPVSEIKSYCEMFEIQGIELRGRVLRQVQSLDRSYLTLLRKHKSDSQPDPDKKPS